MLKFFGLRSSTPRPTTPPPQTNSRKKPKFFSKYLATHKEKAASSKTCPPASDIENHGIHPKAASTPSYKASAAAIQVGNNFDAHKMHPVAPLKGEMKETEISQITASKRQSDTGGELNQDGRRASMGPVNGGNIVVDGPGVRTGRRSDSQNKQPKWSSRDGLQNSASLRENVTEVANVVLPKIILPSNKSLSCRYLRK